MPRVAGDGEQVLRVDVNAHRLHIVGKGALELGGPAGLGLDLDQADGLKQLDGAAAVGGVVG